jgi:hypothetical protein
MNRTLGLSDVGSNPAVVVRELRIVFNEPTVKLDDIGILDNIRARRYEGEYNALTFSLNWLAVPSMQTTRFRPDVGHEQLGCSGFALDVSGSPVVGKSSDSTCTSGRILASSGLRFASVDDPGWGPECARGGSRLESWHVCRAVGSEQEVKDCQRLLDHQKGEGINGR